ncbi:MAG: ATP-dependent Clp protease ATP-binding subunit [Alphaproteobacteria bacterium]|nr:ATP-dependent Clp protease ATP-binding subunit [Alphaproteobacteria bacterium]
MEVTVAAMVGTDKNERVEVRLPGLTSSVFRGPGIAELLDDAALHLMEHVPKWEPTRLHRLILNPEVRLRKVTVETGLAFGGSKKKQDVKARLTCFCTRWPDDGFWIVSVPRLGGGELAVSGLGALDEALAAWLERWAKTGSRAALEAAAPLHDEHLQLVDVEVELPSVLPSRKPKKKRKKKKDPKEAPEEKKPEEKKTWIPAYELRKVGINLVHRAMDGRLQPAYGRDALIDDLTMQLASEGACILLVGEPGVGKTAIIEAVAQRFANPNVTMQERTDLWRVDGGRLISGMSYVGGWEARLARIVEEIHQRDDVLVVDDLPSLAWTGRSAQSETTMAGFLLPHLQRGELRILAECTPERLEAGRQRYPGFFANFRVVQVGPLDALATYRVLLQHLRKVEDDRDLTSRPELLETVMGLARRFGPRMAEPGRSVTIARRFLGEARTEKTDRYERGILAATDVLEHFAAATGLPRFVLEPGTGRAVHEIQAWFQRHIVGQEDAIDAVTDVVATLQQGLDDPDRPVATMLFVGPTGVGKTETAKALAKYLFGDASRLLRFDMSEVRGPGALQRLVGGAGRPDGDLTRAVANQPFSVVLLDEIEKAGPEVFDLLLQVLGEGRLTNAVGRTTDFRNTVVVMTSNLGVSAARRRTGFGQADTPADATHYRKAAEGFFRPEFYNRIDRVVPFRELGQHDVEPLVQRIVGRVLNRRGLRRSGVVVHLDAPMRDWIATVGFDPLYGARSLQRVVERELTVPLARLLVDQPPTERGAYIDLWRQAAGEGTELRMHVDRLVDRDHDPAEIDDLPDWAALSALHGRLTDRLVDLQDDPKLAEILDERSSLMDRLGAGLTDAELDRLETTSAVVEQRTQLVSELEDYAAEWLARYRYEDSWAKVGFEYVERSWDGMPKRQLVTEGVPIPVDRVRGLGLARAQLQALELGVGAVVHRARSFGPPEPLVVRIEPLHEEAGSFAVEIALGISAAWGEWQTPHRLVRGEGGWVEGIPAPGPCALAYDSPGLATLMEPLVGCWLDANDFGADRLLRLVRVEVLEGPDAVALLTARDDDLLALREAVRRGEREPDGLPPVAYRFGALRPEGDWAPKLGETLGVDLRRLALRRVVG